MYIECEPNERNKGGGGRKAGAGRGEENTTQNHMVISAESDWGAESIPKDLDMERSGK